MASYSFKSVGKTADTEITETLETTSIPIGFKTPLRLGEKGEGIFAVHYDLIDQIDDNLRNLILTNHGERLGLFHFGANLRELTTEFASRDDFDEEAIVRIKTAVQKYMPFVELDTFISNADQEKNKDTGIIRITITYNVPLLGVTGRAIEVVLYVI